MKGYRIKTVSRMAGMSPELLRAWERRHGVVTPQRTTGGYREYSEAEVERLRLLALLASRGYSIGEIAGLKVDELEAIQSQGVHALFQGLLGTFPVEAVGFHVTV